MHNIASIPMNADRISLTPAPDIEARNGPVVVVTGASAGVGRAVVRRFAQANARIGLIARGAEGLQGAAEEIRSLGGDALILPADVADADAVERAAATVEAEMGPIDIWINNATTSVFSPVHQMAASEFRRVTEVTYLGYVHGTLAALKRMRSRDRGTIVQVGSALAYRSIPLQSAYCAAKHAIQGFTDSLRCELLHDGSNVWVTSVHLPALNTPQFEWNKTRLDREPQPVPPIFQPEVAAEAIYFASNHRRREVKVGWPTVMAIYGNRVAPGYAEYKLAQMGYDAQQSDTPLQAQRPDNLWNPVAGDQGAHGRFDEMARRFSLLLWANTHRTWVAAAAIAATALTLRRTAANSGD